MKDYGYGYTLFWEDHWRIIDGGSSGNCHLIQPDVMYQFFYMHMAMCKSLLVTRS